VRRAFVFCVAALLAACSNEALGPAPLEFGSETCRWCRMVISDRRFPAQLVAPGQEPLFFDDVDCLAKYLAKNGAQGGALTWVADYKTSNWIRARGAEYYRCPGLASPMSSGIIATAPGGTPTFCPAVDARAVFGREVP
jgi:copper chaperone NosL